MSEIDHSRISDADVRAAALSPGRSFIVQAPAGSGKTELLTQRYLRLLTCVDAPEEILAVTFTRKAAAEMRNRIISAIYPPPGKDKRLKETVALATEVLRRDRELGWQLARYPARLRIRTIDSVNAWLGATAPLLGQIGNSSVSETPVDLYRAAAIGVLDQVSADGELGGAVRSLLLHLDNRSDRLISLLAGMLARRDQWLDFVVHMRRSDGQSATVRGELDSCLYDLVCLELQAADSCLSGAQKDELAYLMSFAAGNLVEADSASPWAACLDLEKLPAGVPEHLEVWRRVGEFLLTGGGTFRKTVNVKQGFPPGPGPQKELKARAVELFTSLSGVPGAAAAFAVLGDLPEPHYTDEQWDILEALLEILQHSVAELMVVFAEQGQADYPAVAQAAISALKDPDDSPTDLALRLDFRINHILIDEFQDTSSAQLKLLTSLTAGWQEGDGRSLFIVGDPMQSIYRFRKAEVGLFLELQRDGLPNLDLQAVTLSTNFRSDPEVMAWVNRVFSEVMPTQDDLTSGAVSYAPGAAARLESAAAGVYLHPLAKPPRVDEANRVGELVQQTLADYPDDDIGILVRSRAHAALIVTALRDRGISFSGAGLENSIDTPVVQDLLCITRALSHRADRTAWLGLLRGPWCGLSLADLEAFAGPDKRTCIWDLLVDKEARARLSAEGRSRTERLMAVIRPVFERRGSLPLRDVVEGVWVELGGPAFLNEQVDIARSEAFFNALDQFDVGGDCADTFSLHQKIVDQLKVEEEGARVNLMTIHKAKGLEFDTVIVSALETGTRGDDKPVMAWQEFVRPDGTGGLLIAPMERHGDDKDYVFELARRLNRAQDSYEKDRLLYVAATRAKLRLHLFFGLAVDVEKGVRAPANGSLLARLWPALDHDVEQQAVELADDVGTEAKPDAWLNPVSKRYQSGWRVPVAPDGYAVTLPAAGEGEPRRVTYDWASSVAKHIGVVVHRWLQRIADEGYENWNAERLHSLCPQFRHMLAQLETQESDLDSAVSAVESALVNTIADGNGQRILSSAHQAAVSEFPVTAVLDGRLQSMVVDRTYIDAEGVRWIIDYKTSPHGGGSLEDFIDQQAERYAGQLRGYRDAMQLLEPERRIKTALYFPLLKVFRELELN